MREFEEIDPLTIEQNPYVVAKLPDDQDPNTTWYVLVIDDYLIIADITYFTDLETKESEWLHYQIEFPKQGLQWYLDTLRNKFFKTAAEGGLPKGVFSDSAVVEGEELLLGRAFNADGHMGGGYSFYTLDRCDPNLPKEYTFTDALLFEHGLFQLFQKVAAKIADGEL